MHELCIVIYIRQVAAPLSAEVRHFWSLIVYRIYALTLYCRLYVGSYS